ncbi:MAG: hypothetical protein IH959_00655 [Chloroflexi bacterium]|nr:hypothetical protein [Chloroflexota bacterium]
MRGKWLLVGVGLLIAVFAIGAVACGDDDDDVEDAIEDILEELDDLGVLQLVAHLEEVDGSGASGEADLSLNGDGILVSLIMEGLTEGSHPNHLHHGTCDDQGEIHITLDGVVADASGDGLQTTANNEEPLSHFETGHYFAVHESDTDLTVVACGNVELP